MTKTKKKKKKVTTNKQTNKEILTRLSNIIMSVVRAIKLQQHQLTF